MSTAKMNTYEMKINTDVEDINFIKEQLKTLIIVHQEFLQDQWIDRIKEYTNATVGIIRQKKCELDKDICIGMLHTICGKDDYDGDKFKDIGLVIYDEVHHLGSEFFSSFLPLSYYTRLKVENLVKMWPT